MRIRRTKLIEEFYFRGKKLRLMVTDRGFSLWDEKDGRWVIDASTLNDDVDEWDGISIGGAVREINPDSGGARLFDPHYAKRRKKKRKSGRRAARARSE